MRETASPCIPPVFAALLLLFPVSGLSQTPWVVKDPQPGTCDVFEMNPGDYFVPSGGTICWAVTCFHPGGSPILVDFEDDFQDTCAQIDCASVTVDCPSDRYNCSPTYLQITNIQVASIGTCTVFFETPVDSSCPEDHRIANQATVTYPQDTLLSNPPNSPPGPTVVTTVAGENYLLKGCCGALPCDIASLFPLPRYEPIQPAPGQTTDPGLTDTTHPICFYRVESPATANSLRMIESPADADVAVLFY